ncbi:hypothetical protein KJ564_05800 [bacterium]|nr:hypothetical protein [bacterium]
MSLKISWINNHPSMQELLLNHRSTVRVLGADASREGDFLSAVDAKDRNLSAFRGISAFFVSPFEAKETNLFRGINTRDDESSDFHFNGAEREYQKDFERSLRSSASDDALLAQNETLRKLIEDDAVFRDALINGDHLRVEQKLGDAAKSELEWTPEITREYLQENPDEALLVAANLGDIQTLLEDSETARALTDNHYDRYRTEVIDRLAETAVSEMEGAQVLDKDFFVERPKAALYLLEHPEERKRLLGDADFEREFINHATTYESLVDPVSKAQDLAGANPALNDDFWSDNEDLSLMMAAEIASGMGNTLQETAHTFPIEAHETTTGALFLRQNQAEHAEEALGDKEVIKHDFLVRHFNLSRLIAENPDFAERLSQDTKTGDLLDSASDEIDTLIRTYASGLPLRNNRSWQWWA